MATSISDTEFSDVLNALTLRPFSTENFIAVLKKRHPLTWRRLVRQYGAGGKGAGKHYSAYSSVSQALKAQSRKGEILTLDYRKAPKDWGNPVIRYWTDKESATENLFPEEIRDEKSYFEGTPIKVFVNRYERDLAARAKCIEHHGLRCVGCELDFGERYGKRGAGFIHVHHLSPLKGSKKSRRVDPKKDLRPVCPNCHAMIHRKEPALTIRELQAICNRNKI